MTKFCRQRLGKYMENYVDAAPGYSYSDEEVIRDGVSELIQAKLFTPEGLQRDILKNCSVLLPLSAIVAWSRK